MTVFADEFAELALPELFDRFGQQVVYADPEYDPVTLTGIVGSVSAVTIEREDGGLDRRAIRELTIARDPEGDYGGIAEPRNSRRDTRVEIDGEDWRFDDDLIARQTAHTTTLRLIQTPVLEKTRPRYRG